MYHSPPVVHNISTHEMCSVLLLGSTQLSAKLFVGTQLRYAAEVCEVDPEVHWLPTSQAGLGGSYGACRASNALFPGTNVACQDILC